MNCKNCTFSSGQWVLSLRKGKRFGRSYSAYRPICLSWYFWPLWWSRLNSLWRYCGENVHTVRSDEVDFFFFYTSFNSPHAEARVCLLVLPPPCLSVSREKKNNQWAARFHHILHKRLEEPMYTYRYLVLIVKKHVNSFLAT